VAVLCLAVALDLLLGDPPSRYHPVAWIGRLIALGRRLSARVPRELLVLYGVLLITVVTIISVMAALAVQAVAGRLPWPLDLVAQAWLLKCSFSIRGLVTAVWRVRDGLEARDLEAARAAVGRDLVSRPVDDLDEAATASAAVESLAENLTDSWVAPLCFYLVASVPGAWAYRAVNTADAMIGYRRGALEDFGKIAARLDDALNFIPARLGALLLVVAAVVTRASAAGALATMWREHARTASPNAGWTMAAMAGALGVTLTKVEHYDLGDGRQPRARDVRRSVRVMIAATIFAGASVAMLLAILRKE